MNIPLAFLSNLAGPEGIIILLIILLLFGAKKLPELAKGMGQAIKEFNKAKDSIHDEIQNAGKTAEAQPAQPTQQSVTQPPQLQTPPPAAASESAPVENPPSQQPPAA